MRPRYLKKIETEIEIDEILQPSSIYKGIIYLNKNKLKFTSIKS